MNGINLFIARFADLREHPDRDVITDLTGMVVENVVLDNSFAGNVVKVIVDRLKSHSTFAPYKLPIFYLIDSILKRVGGPFAPMFGQHFANEIGSFGLANVGERDRRKLEFLFETWRERQFFSLNLVTLMKEALIPMVSESQVQYQLMQNHSQHQQHHQQQQQQQFNANPNFASNQVPSSSGMDRSSASFNNLVQAEMMSLLNEMYTEMGISNRLSLDQLFSANQSLWMQLKTKAEENTVSKINARQQQQQQQSIVASGGTRFGAKRSSDMMMTSDHKLARTTLDNTAMNRSIPVPLQQMQQQQYFSNMQSVSFNDQPNGDSSVASVVSSSSSAAVNVAPSDRTFINGFVCEIPVVVDLDRVRGVAGQLADNYQLVEPVMSEAFQQVALSAASRLDIYIQTAMDPPDLPRILFGPLPLEPVTAAANEALSLVNAEHKPLVHRLPMPEFRSEELGRNPEKAIRGLYGDRPLQFAEDGLRFATQFDLKQHSEVFIARRLNKAKGARESREWYCSCSQWISDFNSLAVRDGSGGSGATFGSGAKTGGSAAAADEEGTSATSGGEEYIVAADEHFTRCPISREIFETTFDAVEGAMLCRNAVKVFVAPPALLGNSTAATAAGDMDTAAVYGLGRPTEEEPQVHYLIVHKYVVDRWLAQGQAASFANALQRYQLTAGGEQVTELLRRAAEVEDEEDLFVKL